MKKLCLSGFAMFMVMSLSAQLNVSFGPNAGFGNTWMSGEGKSQYQPAGNFGVSLIYSATEHFGVGTDLKYSIEGGKREINNVEYSNRLNYVRIPVNAYYFFNNYGDRVRPKISIGPSFGFLVGGKRMVNDVESGDIKDHFKGFDLGIQTTAGVHTRLVSNTWLTLDAGYYHGLSDISEAAGAHRNRNLQFNVGLAVGIGKYVE